MAADYDEEKRTVPGSRDSAGNGSTVSQIDINSGRVISPPDLARLDGSVESFSRSASLAGDTGTERQLLLEWQRTGNTSRSRQRLSGRFHCAIGSCAI